MIHIKEDSPEKLIIISPNTVHKMQGIIFTALGFIFSVAVIGSGEQIYVATFPILILSAGILFLKFGGKPDRVEVDKNKRQVTIVMHDGAFSKDKPRTFHFDEIRESKYGTNSASSRRTLGFDIILNDGSEIQAVPYVNNMKKAEIVYNAFRGALGK